MRNQELNLLMVFDAIMTEGSITRAAERLSMTQPAVSNAVSRMRVVWKDELLIKEGRSINPTLYARNLWSQIREPLQVLGNAVAPENFNPATSNRTFRLAVADAMVDIVWKPLRKIIETEAPGINIHAIPYTIVNGEQVLVDAEVDLVIGTITSGDPSIIRTEYLYTPKYVCIMRPGHPLAKANLTVEEFAAAEHLLVSLSGDVTGYTDQVLAQHGLKRRIAMTVNHFSAVADLIAESDLISVVPPTALEKAIFSGKLAVTKTPVEIQGAQLCNHWHKRQEKDGGLCWLRHHVSHMIKSHAERHFEELKKRFCGAKAA
ncbi:LysR family transcriptional regulator [Planctobacterium marinum]|uniref:LysR family transcriptional regulator n=1 Tax=Planctobacterium marinum TaxID=1631968 RepID=UPI001E5ECBD8|nr:LysR family transcriptional regulator [Planctobacterium marinum]MCC2607399.1 LysR family transcriptional regulator [Planctobacterium marinum]